MRTLPTNISGVHNSSTPNKIRVAIVDDHTPVRRALKTVIDQAPDMSVVGEGANGIEAIELALAKMPDIILMDILMPEMDGIEAAKRISTVAPSVRVLIISICDEQPYIERMRAHGAVGFLSKASGIDALHAAIRAAAAGGYQFA